MKAALRKTMIPGYIDIFLKQGNMETFVGKAVIKK